jgi:FtsH-binding integral membrane protein
MIVCPLYSTVIGAIGSSVLLYCHVDLGGINISNASIAGLFGSFIVTIPAMFFGLRIFPLLISVIISSIWSGIMWGVQWLHVKLAENWMDRSYGSHRGDDPEINMEFRMLPGRD